MKWSLLVIALAFLGGAVVNIVDASLVHAFYQLGLALTFIAAYHREALIDDLRRERQLIDAASTRRSSASRARGDQPS